MPIEYIRLCPVTEEPLQHGATMKALLLAVAGMAALAAPVLAQVPTVPADVPVAPAPAATPVEPIAAILAAFHSCEIVAIGDNHGNEQGHAFRLALIRDPRFAATVN